MIKKIIISMLLLITCFSAFECKSYAYEENGFQYRENEQGTVTIYGYTGDQTEVVIPEQIDGKTVTKIDDSTFYNNDYVTSVTIPGTITQLYYRMFYNCRKLESVVFEEGIIRIDAGFNNCPMLREITIPSSLEYISGYAFTECNALVDFKIDEENEIFKVVNNVLYRNDRLILYPGGKTNEVFEIPDWVTGVDSNASFNENHYLKELIIPNNITMISGLAFQDCRNLEKVTVLEGNNSLYSIDGVVYDENTLIYYPSGKKDETYVVPVDITKTASRSFAYNYYLKNVVLPESLITIDTVTFVDCYQLEELNIPRNVSSIGDFELHGIVDCYNLKAINVDENNEVYHSIDGVLCKNDTLVIYPLNKQDKIYTIPDSITNIEFEAFCNNKYIEKVIFHNNVSSIDSYAFYNCENLIEADLPEGLKAYYEHIFTNTGIKKVVLPRTLIECYLFENSSTGITYYVYPGFGEGLTVNYKNIVELTDQTNNIIFDSWMCDNISENSVFVASKIDAGEEYQIVSDRLEDFSMYDLSLYDENNQILVNDDRFMISIPLTDVNSNCNVYCYENDHLELIDSYIYDGYIKFKANRTGKYVVGYSELKTLLGDVNNNGKVNYSDAVMILQADSKTISLTPLQQSVADVNGDGVVNYNDAVKILQMDAGITG